MNNSLIRLIVPGIVVLFSLILLINQIQQRRHTPANQPPQPQIPLRYLAIGLILLVLGVLFIPWGAADMGGISERIPDSSGTRSDDRFSILNWFSRHLFLPALVQPALMH